LKPIKSWVETMYWYVSSFKFVSQIKKTRSITNKSFDWKL